MANILLAEDDSTLAVGLEYALKNEGFNVKWASTIKAAIEAFYNMPFDLIILDVMLPDGSGYDFCKDIRKDSNVPIVFLTSHDQEVNIVLGLDIGGDDYVTKPFRIMELISRIKAVLRRHNTNKSEESHCLISGNIKVYTELNKVTKNDKEVILTPLEYRLLLTFIKHSSQVLPRNKILERLWDIDGEFVDDNTLSVYVRRLREKVEADPSQPSYIKTVRGIGYKWDSYIRRDLQNG